MAVDAAQRFWDKVEKTETCWLWTAGTVSTLGGRRLPYGKFWLDGRDRLAHIVAWEWAYGRVPDGLQLDHLCRQPRCVRVSHLEPVPPRVNTDRSPVAPAAVNGRKEECDSGHAFDVENTRHWRGKRICRACARETMRRLRARSRD